MPYFGIPIRNGLPIGLGSVAGFGIAPFSPDSLFENGEQGAWYDPSDYSTLFDTSAGTTPVSAPGNGSDVFVGLMLDKSKGGRQSLPITGWAQTSGDGVVTVNGGTITITGATTTTRVDIAAPGWVVGNYADITINGTVSGAVGPLLFIGGSPFTINAGTNTYRSVVASSNLCRVQVTSGSATFDVTSRGIVPGNHAFQTSSTKRPELRARYNLLTNTPFAGGGAAPTGYTQPVATGTSAPDGAAANGDTIYLQTATAQRPFLSITITAPVSLYTASFTVYAVTGTITYADILSSSTATGGSYTNNGVVVSSSAQVTPGRIVLDGLTTTSGSPIFRFGLGVQANVTGTLRFSSPDVRPASQATGLIGPTYQRVAAATVYDTAGFLPYLAFNGLDDNMSTVSHPFTFTGPVSFFCGFTPTSFANVYQSLFSAGTAGVAANNLHKCIDFMAAVNSPAISGGPYWSTDIWQPSGIYSTPQLTVQTQYVGVWDISNWSTHRTSGASAKINGTSGTINSYGANNPTALNSGPMQIGVFDPVALPASFFEGRLYSLIAVAAQYSQSQIEATEAWVNGKTGAY